MSSCCSVSCIGLKSYLNNVFLCVFTFFLWFLLETHNLGLLIPFLVSKNKSGSLKFSVGLGFECEL